MRLVDISKNYYMGKNEDNVVKVLKDINLHIENKDLIAITGPSGAGKSTLLHIIGGLEMPTEGNVFYNGSDIYKLSSKAIDEHRNQNIGFVFQFHYLLSDFTAFENVLVPALIAGKRNKDAEDRANHLLNKVGLTNRTQHFPSELSGGEQQRVALARALMNSPKIILADEPTGNLDRVNSEIVQELLFSLKEEGVAVVIVTHDQSIADKCDKNIHLEKV